MKHPIKYQIIQALADGQFHSGEALGEQLSMTRAAISKHIKGMMPWGIDIESLKGKGYQISQPLDLLSRELIAASVTNKVELIPVIDSTNQYLMDQFGQLEQGQVCLAEYQTKGRGRRGRQWISPFGTNLYLSMYWNLEAGLAAAMGLSLVIGVATVRALESLGAQNIQLKWPNDIYHENKKLAGILIELTGQSGGAAELVIGMGLNIYPSSQQQLHIDQPWTHLESIFNQQVPNRNQITIALIEALQQALVDYEENGMKAYVSDWNQLDNFKDLPVMLMMGDKEIIGIERGIDEQGAIQIETSQGLKSYIGGELSLRRLS